MSTAHDNDDLPAKTQEILKHLTDGGTLKTLANLSGQELEAIYAVAYNLFTARKYDQAIDLFKFLCLYDHTEPRWFYGLGVARQRKGDYAQAVDAFAVATLLDVEDPRPQVQAAYCLMALGNWPEAQSALEGTIMACGEEADQAGLRAQAEAMLATVRKKTKEDNA